MTETPEEENQQPHSAPNRSRKKALLVVVAVAVIALLATVGANPGWLPFPPDNGDNPSLDDNPNSAPEITSVSVNTERIEPLAVTAVSCEAMDPDGDGLTYAWSSSGGEIIGDGPQVEWLAPETEGLYRVFISVSDGRGGTTEQSLAVRVRTDNPPEILVMESGLGADVGWVVPGAGVYVRCEAEDRDGDSLTYRWSATAGELFGEGPAVIWVAPEELGLHWVTVEVSDSYGGREERQLPLTVNLAQPPVILGFSLEALDTDMFRPYGDSWRIFKESSCAIRALVDDKEGVFTYDWSAERGTITEDGPNALWVAPASPKGWVNIVLRVSDLHGNQSSASVRIYVETCPSCMHS